MLKEDFIISIEGTQNYHGEKDESRISVDTYGTYAKRGGSRYITYKEYEDGNMSEGKMSVLKIEEDSTVTMIKAGSPTRLILEKGKRHNCVYTTAYGNMTLGVYTKTVVNKLDDNGGELEVTYTMDVNSAFASENKVHVKVKPAKF